MDGSTVRSLLRCTQAFCSQICEKETLAYGIAYHSARFADLPQANQFREVAVDDPARHKQAFEEVEEWFRRQGLLCHRWAPAGGDAGEQLADFLANNGFRPRRYYAMVLTEWVGLKVPDDVRVLHARAMRAALRTTFVDADSPASTSRRELLADACEERLDDPSFDMYVALVDGRPAGRCALFQVGDIARVMDLTVLTEFAPRGVDSALTMHVLALAKRLSIRNICLQVGTADTERRSWYERAGFAADGLIDEFERDPSVVGGASS
jgi:GNAT superfamily N-acetyltransferase